MADFTEVISAAELKQQPAPFVASQSGAVNAPTATEEQQLRALFQEAANQGKELTDIVTIPQAPEPAATATTPIPQKFQKPDGTVDEDKLKASSKQLDAAIEQKQKTVDELLADYKEREKQLGTLGNQAGEIKQQMPPAPMQMPVQNESQQDLAVLQQRIMQDYQRDPVATTVQLAEAIATKKMEPFMERLRQDEISRRESEVRDGLAKVAQTDPRILDPRLYEVVKQVLAEEPNMRQLKNPHKAAWNEVKERLRLGEPQVQAQPSIPSPTLGRGSPPSVSTLPGPMSAQSAYQQAVTIAPLSADGKAYEEKLRELTRNLWD